MKKIYVEVIPLLEEMRNVFKKKMLKVNDNVPRDNEFDKGFSLGYLTAMGEVVKGFNSMIESEKRKRGIM